MYKLKPVFYEKGEIILRAFAEITSLMLINKGVVDVYTTLEGNEFVLDRLYPGSVINHRAFIMEDLMSVNLRCHENCLILEQTFDDFKAM